MNEWESDPLYGIYDDQAKAEQRVLELYQRRSEELYRICEIPLNEAVEGWAYLEDFTPLRQWVYRGNGFELVDV